MHLKHYQREALDKLQRFFVQAQLAGPAQAYARVAPQEGNPYAGAAYQAVPGLEDCPHVCLRLPTGGGKTLLAARTISLAAKFQDRQFPVVLWMTPSNIIREQTVDALRNHRHPYRQALNEDFGGQVEILDIGDFAQLRTYDLMRCACIVVTTMQALRVSDTKGRNVYASNEFVYHHFKQIPPENLENLDLKLATDGSVMYSFANLLHIVRPLVIVDEAHNAVTELTRELHRRIRPACIVEFTATPRDTGGKALHNVLVSVPATRLRDEEMIKLPIALTEHQTWQAAVNGAVAERARLAAIARREGEPFRPVVLYQAQNQNQPVPVEKLKAHLVESEGIAPHQIAVATGKKRELDGVDMNDPQCPVEHVITVQALKEGWDCPAAYVLCSVANVGSTTAVEQLLGRVLRMPFASRRSNAELNRAYAHIPETQFAHAAHALRDKLVKKMGFEEEEAEQAVQPQLPEFSGESDPLFSSKSLTVEAETQPDFSQCSPEEIAETEQAVKIQQEADGAVKVIIRDALPEAAQEAIARAAPEPERAKTRVLLRNWDLAKRQRRSPAQRGVPFAPLPQLFFLHEGDKLEASLDRIEDSMEWNPLDQNFLLEEGEFNLTETASGFELSLILEDKREKLIIEKTGTYHSPELPLVLRDKSEAALLRWLEREIRIQFLTQETMIVFVQRNLTDLMKRDISLEKLTRFKYALAQSLKKKLRDLRQLALDQSYQQRLFDPENKPLCEYTFEFSKDNAKYEYDFSYSGRYRFQKHYYGVVGNLKSEGEEYECAVALDGMEEVKHWIRNVEKKPNSFCLPGPKQRFFPDFVAELNDGRILVVEYKGAHMKEYARDNRAVGELWEAESNNGVVFVMPTYEKGAKPVLDQIREKL